MESSSQLANGTRNGGTRRRRGSREMRALRGLPWARFTTIVIFFVSLDPLVCLGLWLGGGNSAYLRHSVDDFSFSHSTFDLALLAVVRGFSLVSCLYLLERYSLLALTARGQAKRRAALRNTRLCRAVVFATATISILYLIAKGAVILHQISTGSWDSVNTQIRMHVSYRILCVFALVFPLLELGVGVASWFFVGRSVRLRRLQLLINAEDGEEDDDDEEDEEGKKKKRKKADLKRLILLAKPVINNLILINLKYTSVCTVGVSIDGCGNTVSCHVKWCNSLCSVPLWKGDRFLSPQPHQLVMETSVTHMRHMH